MRVFVPALLAAFIASCSSPPPPVIPPRETIGPPREAATECKPPTRSFAQRFFWIADLDLGTSCKAFIEQDECVVAIFRDCTDNESTPPRSWQGAIDSGMNIEIERNRATTGGMMTRAPISCEGPLIDPKPDEAVWAKLSCRIAGGTGQAPHGGFYLEKVPVDSGDPPFPIIGTRGGEIEVARTDMPFEGYAPDFVVLEKGELWAIVDGNAGDPATGLYSERVSEGRLTKLSSLSLTNPSVIRASRDESAVYVADGNTLYRVETQTRAVLSATPTTEAITDLATIPNGVLVAAIVRTSPSAATKIELRDFGDLGVQTSTTIRGQVAQIVETPVTEARIALLRLKNEHTLVTLRPDLTLGPTIELSDVPSATAYVPGLDLVLYGVAPPTALAILDVTTMERTVMRLPEAGEPISYLYDVAHERMLIGTKGGLLTALDLVGRRPHLQSRIDFGATLSKLHLRATTNIIYALRGPEGLIDPLQR